MRSPSKYPTWANRLHPLAPSGFAVPWAEPGSGSAGTRLAGLERGHQRGESRSHDLGGADQWVQSLLSSTTIQPPTGGHVLVRAGLQRVRVHLRHFHTHAGPEASRADPRYLQRDCLRSIWIDAFYVGGCAYDASLSLTRDATTGLCRQFSPRRRLCWATGWALASNIAPNGATAVNNQVGVYPCAAGVAVSQDGQTLVVANYYNDSISVFTGGLNNWKAVPGPDNLNIPGLDLRPGKSDSAKAGKPGGEYPFWVVVKGTMDRTPPPMSPAFATARSSW